MPESFFTWIKSQKSQLLLAFRSTFAAILALVICKLCGFENPYWGALTALVVIQPTWGLLLEKSLIRIFSTCFGALTGLAILYGCDSIMLTSIALALFLGLNVIVGNLFYGLRSYGFMVTGMTCAVVVMTGHLMHATSTVVFGRIACTLVGVIVATLVTGIFTQKNSTTQLSQRLTALSADSIRWLATQFVTDKATEAHQQESSILAQLSALEGEYDAATAGMFFTSQHLNLKQLLSLLMSLLGTGQLINLQKPLAENRHQSELHQEISKKLFKIAELLEQNSRVSCLSELEALFTQLKQKSACSQSLNDLQLLLREILICTRILQGKRPDNHFRLFLRHRDLSSGIRSGIRVMACVILTGVAWSLTRWELMPLMIMAEAIMLTLFTTMVTPSVKLQHVLIGAPIGGVIAVLLKLTLLANGNQALLEIAILALYLFFGTFAITQQRISSPAIDATYIFLLILQPGSGIEMSSQDIILGAVAMLAGITISLLAYQWIYPLNPKRRLQVLQDSIFNDVCQLSSMQHAHELDRIEARLKHKTMRAIILARQYVDNPQRFVDNELKLLSVVICFRQLRQLMQFNDLKALQHDLHSALANLKKYGFSSAHVLSQLELTNFQLDEDSGSTSDSFSRQQLQEELKTALRTTLNLLNDNFHFWDIHNRKQTSFYH